MLSSGLIDLHKVNRVSLLVLSRIKIIRHLRVAKSYRSWQNFHLSLFLAISNDKRKDRVLLQSHFESWTKLRNRASFHHYANTFINTSPMSRKSKVNP